MLGWWGRLVGVTPNPPRIAPFISKLSWEDTRQAFVDTSASNGPLELVHLLSLNQRPGEGEVLTVTLVDGRRWVFRDRPFTAPFVSVSPPDGFEGVSFVPPTPTDVIPPGFVCFFPPDPVRDVSIPDFAWLLPATEVDVSDRDRLIAAEIETSRQGF